MTRFIKWFLLSIFLTAPLSTRADVRVVGNGGHVVICKDSAGRMQSIDVLDSYEARHMGVIDLGSSQLSLEAKVEFALARFEKLNKPFANELRARAKEFFKTATYYSDLELPESNDEGQVILGNGCALHQIALQQLSPLPGGKFYIINDRFWKMLPADDKATLVLHEVVYSYFHDKGATNSKNARLLNAMLIQNKLSDLSPKDFSNLLKRFVAQSKAEPAVQPAITTLPVTLPSGLSSFVFLNESFFKSSSAQSVTLGVDQKCFVPRKTALAVEILSEPTVENPDHYKVKLRQMIPGCVFGREGAIGYLFTNHVSKAEPTK